MRRTLYAFLLAVAMSCQALADDARSRTSILLVADPELADPNFRRATVLVMNNLGAAPAGVIVNRPTRVRVSRLFPDVARLANLDDRVYFGGPVQMTTLSFLFRADTPPEQATRVIDGVFASTDRELLRKLLGREKPMEGLRIFVGYSGWAPGQLEAEIARGGWTIATADASAIFDGKLEYPWPDPEAPGSMQRI